MKSAIFYYGLDLPPDRSKTTLLRDTAVVLQPHHPLLSDDIFADYFPHCSLFVYWNPTGVQPESLRAASEQIPLVALDHVWDLVRLDLRSDAARRFAVGQGLRALRQTGAHVHGLFVDDLDLWSGPRRQSAAIAVLRQLQAEGAQDIRLFLNRAFSLWPKLDCLQAVLLEELTPGVVKRLAPADTEWVERKVLPAIRRVRRRGVTVFGMTYEPTWEKPPHSRVSAGLAEVTDNIVMTCRSLDQWPEDLQ